MYIFFLNVRQIYIRTELQLIESDLFGIMYVFHENFYEIISHTDYKVLLESDILFRIKKCFIFKCLKFT